MASTHAGRLSERDSSFRSIQSICGESLRGEMSTSSESPPNQSKGSIGLNLLTSAQEDLSKQFDKTPSAAAMGLGAALIGLAVVAQLAVEILGVDFSSPPHVRIILSPFEFTATLVVGLLLVFAGALMRMYTYRRNIEFEILKFEKGADLVQIGTETGRTLAEGAASSLPNT